ncbi:macrophage-expressed gene 1 protein-like [Anneissia japonica]|uniref:macrophage-expressed gene 1 protein-like n=1 Tax=Anneissia japonica TaxID=1529436 RepID=UPI00142560BD|nr:macrophage-expressed gene 1 protein-like [Anneissia japonica]
MRHRLYKIFLGSRLTLNREFKSLVIEIGNTLANSENVLAEYLADTLVRDYGTHVLTTVDAGAAIIQESQIKRTLMSTYSMDQLSAMATASASFLRGRISAMVSLEARINAQSMKSFQTSTTNSHIESYGGNIYKTDVDDWESSIKENLVTIDKAGEPLHTIITSKNIENLPPFLVRQVSIAVESAISRYYVMNTITGCTDITSPNFNFLANRPNDISDMSDLCTTDSATPDIHFRFGGVFTRCMPPRIRNSKICDRLKKNNPKTNTDSCPTDYYDIMVFRESMPERYYVKGKRYTAYAQISVYWCAGREATVEEDWNVFDYFNYFGGMYTHVTPNPFTMTRGCPQGFMPLPLGSDLNVCVSDTTDSQVEFGGFFTCKVGNPFAIELASNIEGRPNSNYPKHCPKGFGSLVATIKNNCQIMYCIKYKSEMKRYFNTATPEISIKRPPYIHHPEPSANATNTMTFSDEGYTWKKDETTGEWTKDKKTSSLSGFLAASLAPTNAASLPSTGFLAACLGIIMLHHYHQQDFLPLVLLLVLHHTIVLHRRVFVHNSLYN